MADHVRILIADDHQIFRDGLKLLLESEPGLEVIGEAENGRDAVAMAVRLKPDLILMDLQMPELDGIEAARQIVSALPEVKILMLTMFDDDPSIFSSMRAGARGYILKGVRREKMLRAIWAAAGGEAIFSPGIASRMMDYFSNFRQPSAEDLFPELSAREREVLVLLARNVSNAEIAQQLFINPKTVRNHVSNVLMKLQASSRLEAGRIARDAGMG